VVIGQEAFADAIRAGDTIADADLSEIDWEDLPSGRVSLRNCLLRGASLAEAGLGEAQFDGVSFFDCRFAAADLVNARFSQCSFFDGEDRTGCDFADAQLRGASFLECNLSLARFAGANLHGATLDRCKASGADFEDASFARKSGRTVVTAGRLVKCVLDFVNFRNVPLDKVVFEGSSLRQADFSRCDLTAADFRDADLSAAIVSEAQLDDVDLRGASVSGLDLTRARSFGGIKVNESQLSALAGPFGMRVFPD